MRCFDTLVPRRGTDCVKWDAHAQQNVSPEAIPLWVADMDFEIPAAVTEALQQRAAHEVYGYPLAGQDYFCSIQNWMLRRHDWQIETDWIVPVPGVVPAINLAIQAFTEPGDGILIQRPVYPPFINAAQGEGRRLVNNPLVLKDDSYHLDMADFEAKIVDQGVKLFVLCSPHNPVGRVWTREELKQMGDICLEHNVLIVSDEIHHDLIFPGEKHYPLPVVDPAYNKCTLVCTAPSKTFNIAGLKASNIIIPDAELREKFAATASRWGLGVNSLGLVACQAAYSHGDEWLDEVMKYVHANRAYVQDYLERFPMLKLTQSQGLYLLWLDCRGLGLSAEELEDFMLDQAGLWLNQGHRFGQEGRGFVRINIACPRSLLVQAMEQLSKAIK